MNETTFINLLSRYFNYGFTGPFGKLAACVRPAIPMAANAAMMLHAEKQFNPIPVNQQAVNFDLPFYSGANETVKEIGNYLHQHLRDEVAHAIIHGSVATDEIINYSDFDGLIVLKNEVFKSKTSLINTAKHLNMTYKMMLNFDPHQHHGWVILTEKQIHDWPCSYFPPEILKHARSVQGFNNHLNLRFDESKHYSAENLKRYCNNFMNKLRLSGIPSNLFQLKSLLSEFMLIPSLFIQAKTGKGCFKKESFTQAGAYFSPDEWQIMNEVSTIRTMWPAIDKSTIQKGYFTPVTRYRQIHDHQSLPLPFAGKLNAEQMIKLAQLFIAKI